MAKRNFKVCAKCVEATSQHQTRIPDPAVALPGVKCEAIIMGLLPLERHIFSSRGGKKRSTHASKLIHNERCTGPTSCSHRTRIGFGIGNRDARL